MKTITVLTDFSPGSEHAARYALHLAQKMKTNVLLYSPLLVVAEMAADEQYVLPCGNDNDCKTDTENRLKELAAMLSDELKGRNFPGTVLPAIDYRCEGDLTTDMISGYKDDNNVILAVIAGYSPSQGPDVMANDFRRLLDSSYIPILIVPENAAIRNVEKFVFATGASYSDIAYINALSGLAKLSTAEILVANVDQPAVISSEQEATVKRFKEGIITDVNYSRVYYRSVPNNTMRTGLQWLTENIKFDMLVMVRRNDDFYDFAFNPGLTNNPCGHVERPLLVYPSSGVSIPLL